jgi:hypothetical protein
MTALSPNQPRNTLDARERFARRSRCAQASVGAATKAALATTFLAEDFPSKRFAPLGGAI